LQHLNSKSKDLDIYFQGLVSYEESRNFIRKKLHVDYSEGKRGGVVFSEHVPTLTLGKRYKAHLLSPEEIHFWEDKGVAIVETDRGGQWTYHDQGQLMIYPVLSLPGYGISLRFFVRSVLNSISYVCRLNGLNTFIDEKLQGVWLISSGKQKKIASAGFRIIDGMSDHGVAVYLSEISEYFSFFSPCGMSVESLTSFYEELGESYNFDTIRESFFSHFPEYFWKQVVPRAKQIGVTQA
jgi:lipoyl(octanoyl) transferase